jgi:hypothetical protein
MCKIAFEFMILQDAGYNVSAEECCFSCMNMIQLDFWLNELAIALVISVPTTIIK